MRTISVLKGKVSSTDSRRLESSRMRVMSGNITVEDAHPGRISCASNYQE